MSLTLDDYVNTIKQGQLDIGTKLGTGVLVSACPLLANPILFSLTQAAVHWFLSKLLNETEYGLFTRYIDLRTSQQGRAFYDAVIKAEAVNKNGTAEEKQAAEDAKVRSFYNLVSMRS